MRYSVTTYSLVTGTRDRVELDESAAHRLASAACELLPGWGRDLVIDRSRDREVIMRRIG